MNNYSYIKRLPNDKHIQFIKEFVSAIPEGSGEFSCKERIIQSLREEEENLSKCRKNHLRVKFVEKMKEVRMYLSSYYSMVKYYASEGDKQAVAAKEHYDILIKGKRSYLELVSATQDLLQMSQNLNEEILVELLNEVSEKLSQANEMIPRMSAEDANISTLKPQSDIRKKTDRYMQVYIQWLTLTVMGYHTLADSADDEMVVKFRMMLSYTKKWTDRAKTIVKRAKMKEDIDVDESVSDEIEDENDNLTMPNTNIEEDTESEG